MGVTISKEAGYRVHYTSFGEEKTKTRKSNPTKKWNTLKSSRTKSEILWNTSKPSLIYHFCGGLLSQPAYYPLRHHKEKLQIDQPSSFPQPTFSTPSPENSLLKTCTHTAIKETHASFCSNQCTSILINIKDLPGPRHYTLKYELQRDCREGTRIETGS